VVSAGIGEVAIEVLGRPLRARGINLAALERARFSGSPRGRRQQ
jgi:hypothetical protein